MDKQALRVAMLTLATEHFAKVGSDESVLAVATKFVAFVEEGKVSDGDSMQDRDARSAKTIAEMDAAGTRPDRPPVEQLAPVAPQPAGKTHDDCKKAFVAYLGKGGGRSAAKFVNEIMTPKFGVKNIMQVPADRLDELHADLEAA